MAAFDIEQFVRTLIRIGSTYDTDAFPQVYDSTLEIVVVPPQGEAVVYDYAANLDFFRQRRDSGLPPMDQTVRFLHTSQTDRDAVAIVERPMALTGNEPQSVIFTLTMRHTPAGWRVIRETGVIRA